MTAARSSPRRRSNRRNSRPFLEAQYEESLTTPPITPETYSTIVVADAGTGAVNGTYTWDDDDNGWVNGGFTLRCASGSWEITDGVDTQYGVLGNGTPMPPKTGWFNDAGANPPPTLDYG